MDSGFATAVDVSAVKKEKKNVYPSSLSSMKV